MFMQIIERDNEYIIQTSTDITVNSYGYIGQEDEPRDIYTEKIVVSRDGWDNLIRALLYDVVECVADDVYPVRITKWGPLTELRQKREVVGNTSMYGYVKLSEQYVQEILAYTI
jgi:hypothetical protein